MKDICLNRTYYVIEDLRTFLLVSGHKEKSPKLYLYKATAEGLAKNLGETYRVLPVRLAHVPFLSVRKP